MSKESVEDYQVELSFGILFLLAAILSFWIEFSGLFMIGLTLAAFIMILIDLLDTNKAKNIKFKKIIKLCLLIGALSCIVVVPNIGFLEKYSDFLYVLNNFSTIASLGLAFIVIAKKKSSIPSASTSGNVQAVQNQVSTSATDVASTVNKTVLAAEKNASDQNNKANQVNEEEYDSLDEMVDDGVLTLNDRLRANYKRNTYYASLIRGSDGVKIKFNDTIYNSVSAAGKEITGYSVNGWTFWEAIGPNGQSKGKLEDLRKLKRR